MKIIPKRGEKIQVTLKRFRKLLEKDGIIKEIKRQMYYETPSEIKSRIRRKFIRDREREQNELKNPKSVKEKGNEN